MASPKVSGFQINNNVIAAIYAIILNINFMIIS